MSVSLVLPELAKLYTLNRISEDDPTYITNFKRTMREELKLRKLALTNSMLVKVATALDPRHKTLSCISRAANRDATYTFITNLITLDIQADNAEDEGSSVCSVPKKFKYDHDTDDEDEDELSDVGETTVVQSSARQDAERIVALYRSYPEQPDTVNPLNWWKANAAGHMRLSKLAARYLASPGTSVPSERVFSSAGNIISKKRASLTPQNANMLVCLGSWL